MMHRHLQTIQKVVTKTTYNTKTLLTNKCKSDNAECCKKYNKISINSNNFGEKQNITQQDNLICNLSSIKNVEQKCMELCQTNKNCAAYSTSNFGCNLFSNVTAKVIAKNPDNQDLPSNNSNFYIKNV